MVKGNSNNAIKPDRESKLVIRNMFSIRIGKAPDLCCTASGVINGARGSAAVKSALVAVAPTILPTKLFTTWLTAPSRVRLMPSANTAASVVTVSPVRTVCVVAAEPVATVTALSAMSLKSTSRVPVEVETMLLHQQQIDPQTDFFVLESD